MTTKLIRKGGIRSMAFCAALAGAVSLPAADSGWPGWRGPAGNGSAEGGNYPSRLGEKEVAWKRELPGKGGSTPIVVGERIILTSPSEGEDAVMAFDLKGDQQWVAKLGSESPPKHRTLGSSCNASPVSDGKAVFAYFRSGNFAAVGLDGAVIWKQNINEMFGPERLYWDQGSSPVVTGKEVVLTRMNQGKSWIAGFDKATGKLSWQQERNYSVPSENDNGYTTPVHFQHAGRDALLVWGADHLTAHSATDGKMLWWSGEFNPSGTRNWPAIASPLVVGDVAVVPVGRDDRQGQSSVYGVKLGGAGEVTKTHRLWLRDDVGVFVTSPVEHQGQVYLLRHRGEVVRLDPKTGRTVWAESLPKGNSSYYASPAIANGVLYAAREDGSLFAAKVGEKFELLSEHSLGERVVASPALAGGKILIRGDRHLWCFEAR